MNLRLWNKSKAANYARTIGPGHYSRKGKAKREYQTKREAESGWKGSVYVCPTCKAWHRTTGPLRRER